MDLTAFILVPIAYAIISYLRRRRARRREQEFLAAARAREQAEALKKEMEKKLEPPPKPRPFSVQDAGFVKLGELNMGMTMGFYWHPTMKMELALSNVNGRYVMKGMKKYYVKAISESGHETWDRSLGTVMDILRASFPEFHVYGCGIT